MKCLFKGPPRCVNDALSSSNYCQEHQGFPGTVMKFAGDMSLADLRNALTSHEVSSQLELIDLRTEGGNNVAFLKQPSEPLIGSNLFFVAVEPEAIHEVKTEHVALGKRFLFSRSILVNEEETQVLGFREEA